MVVGFEVVVSGSGGRGNSRWIRGSKRVRRSRRMEGLEGAGGLEEIEVIV